jgi:hypothetical protein
MAVIAHGHPFREAVGAGGLLCGIAPMRRSDTFVGAL